MDEAFVDLCRQIIRKDVGKDLSTKHVRDMERLDRGDRDRPRRGHRKRKKKGFLEGGGPRCNIL